MKNLKKITKYDYPSLKRIEMLASLVEGVEGKKVLDIGCRDSILRKYLPSNVDYYGMDKFLYDQTFKEQKVFIADICSRVLPKEIKRNFFETVVLGEVLEHLSNPVRALQNIKKLLCDGGRVVGSTPNSLAWRFFFFFEFIHPKRVKANLNEESHLYSFDKDTLRNLLIYSGFKIKILKEWGNWIPHTKIFLPFNLRGAHLIFVAEK